MFSINLSTITSYASNYAFEGFKSPAKNKVFKSSLTCNNHISCHKQELSTYSRKNIFVNEWGKVPFHNQIQLIWSRHAQVCQPRILGCTKENGSGRLQNLSRKDFVQGLPCGAILNGLTLNPIEAKMKITFTQCDLRGRVEMAFPRDSNNTVQAFVPYILHHHPSPFELLLPNKWALFCSTWGDFVKRKWKSHVKWRTDRTIFLINTKSHTIVVYFTRLFWHQLGLNCSI